MKLQRRDFSLLLTLAAAVSTTALGQAAPPAGAPNAGSAVQRVGSTPDFSGVWVHPVLSGRRATGIGAWAGLE
jgi:hypothetical protein